MCGVCRFIAKKKSQMFNIFRRRNEHKERSSFIAATLRSLQEAPLTWTLVGSTQAWVEHCSGVRIWMGADSDCLTIDKPFEYQPKYWERLSLWKAIEEFKINRLTMYIEEK